MAYLALRFALFLQRIATRIEVAALNRMPTDAQKRWVVSAWGYRVETDKALHAEIKRLMSA